MDITLAEGIVASASLLLVLYCIVWLFRKLASVFPSSPKISGETGSELCPTMSRIDNVSAPRQRQVIAIDTDTVGAGDSEQVNMLARVAIVNDYDCMYDQYVAPVQPVTDFRTGSVCEEDLVGAESFIVVQWQVRDLMKGCVLVGYDVEKDLSALDFSHLAEDIRDVALYQPFRTVPHEKPSLKDLAQRFLGRSIQDSEHNCEENAKAALDLYYLVENEWERALLNPQ